MLNHLTFFGAVILFATSRGRSDFTEELQELTDHIARSYFDLFRCIAYVTDRARDSKPIRVAYSTVMVVDYSGATSELLTRVYDEGCAGFVIWMSSWNRLKLVRDLIRAYKKSLFSRYNDKRYLFLPEDEDDDDAAFLESPDMYYMPNLVFVASSGNASGYRVLGHNFFDGHKYDVLKVKHEVLDDWHSGTGFARRVHLYPDRVSNLNGKVVRLSLIHYSPYGLVLNGSDGVTEYDGLETRVAVQFVESLNGTWIGLDNPVHLWGEIFDNGTGTGVFGSILENKADIGYSAIYQWYCDVLECSRPYVHSDVTCLAPKPEVVSGYLTVLLPFQSQTWLAVACFFLLSWFFAFLIRFLWERITGGRGSRSSCCRDVLRSFYEVFQLQLEQVPRSASDRSPLADYYKMIGLYTFLLAVCWQGGISSFLTVPRYEKPINEAKDLVEKFPKMRWGANHIAWVESIREEEDPVLQLLVKEFVVENSSALMKRVSKKNFAYFMERLQNGHYALNTYIDEEGMKYLRIMQKNIYGGYVVMILTRGSPYQQRLDEILLRMFDAGLISKIELQVSLERINNKLQNMVRSSTDTPRKELIMLGFTHVQGALYLYVLGTVLSTVVFFVELQHYRIAGRTTRESRTELVRYF